MVTLHILKPLKTAHKSYLFFKFYESFCKLKPQNNQMSNDTICFRFEHIRKPRLLSETQSALNCGMVCVRGRESSKLWSLGDTNIRDSFYHERGRKWQGPQDSHSTDCYEVCGMQKNGCRKRGILFISAQFEPRQPLVQQIYNKPTKSLAGFSCTFGSLLQMASISERPINMFYKMIKGPDEAIRFVQRKNVWRSCRRSIEIDLHMLT